MVLSNPAKQAYVDNRSVIVGGMHLSLATGISNSNVKRGVHFGGRGEWEV